MEIIRLTTEIQIQPCELTRIHARVGERLSSSIPYKNDNNSIIIKLYEIHTIEKGCICSTTGNIIIKVTYSALTFTPIVGAIIPATVVNIFDEGIMLDFYSVQIFVPNTPNTIDYIDPVLTNYERAFDAIRKDGRLSKHLQRMFVLRIMQHHQILPLYFSRYSDEELHDLKTIVNDVLEEEENENVLLSIGDIKKVMITSYRSSGKTFRCIAKLIKE